MQMVPTQQQPARTSTLAASSSVRLLCSTSDGILALPLLPLPANFSTTTQNKDRIKTEDPSL